LDKILIFIFNEFKNIDFAIPNVTKSINQDKQLLEISRVYNLNFKKINTVEVHLLRLNKTGYELMIKLITPVVNIDYFINSDINNRFEEPSAITIEPNLSMHSQIGIELKKINSQRSKDLYLYNTSNMKKIKIKIPSKVMSGIYSEMLHIIKSDISNNEFKMYRIDSIRDNVIIGFIENNAPIWAVSGNKRDINSSIIFFKSKFNDLTAVSYNIKTEKFKVLETLHENRINTNRFDTSNNSEYEIIQHILFEKYNIGRN